MKTTVQNMISVRLNSQGLLSSARSETKSITQRLTGIQAQDEPGARWSIGLRMPGSAEKDIAKAIDDHQILRTWLFRGTLHYVARDDILWLLDVVAPRIIHTNARRSKQLDLDNKIFKKSQDAIQKQLEETGEASRAELKEVLNKAGIPTEGQQIAYLLQRAALDQLIYISGKRGRETLFRLLSELGLPQKELEKSSAMALLAKRYFRGHGPVTVHDFAWWSGFTVSDARQGISDCEGLTEIKIENDTYYFFNDMKLDETKPTAWLLPSFDEYLLGYSDRGLVLDPSQTKLVNRGGGFLQPTLMINGRVAGIWQKNEKAGEISLVVTPFGKIEKDGLGLIEEAVSRLSTYYQKPVSFTVGQ